MSDAFEPNNETQQRVSSAKTTEANADSSDSVNTAADDTALEDAAVRYIENLLASNRSAGPVGYKPDSYVRQYDTHLNNKYNTFNVFKQFAIMRLYHYWTSVVGSLLGKQTKLLEIKPPVIKVAAMTSPCLQQLQMMKKQLLKKINKFYGAEVITDLQCVMYRKSYIKEIEPGGKTIGTHMNGGLLTDANQAYRGTVNKYDSYERVLLNFEAIPISPDVLKQIEQSVATIKNEELRNQLRNVQIKQHKKNTYLKAHGYHTCKHCENLIAPEETICVTCTLKAQEHEAFLYRQHINRIKDILMMEPFAIYEDICRYVPQCTMADYQLAHRECVYFFRNRVVRESSDENYDIYMLLMLITHKKAELLKPEFVRNSVLKMRSQYEQAIRGRKQQSV